MVYCFIYAASQCGPTIKQLKLKFTPGSMAPFYPNEYTGCVNGCDTHLIDMLNIRPLRRNQGGGVAGKLLDFHTSFGTFIIVVYYLY